MLISGLRRLIGWFHGFMAPRTMNGKVRYIAGLPEVIVTRDGDFALFVVVPPCDAASGFGLPDARVNAA